MFRATLWGKHADMSVFTAMEAMIQGLGRGALGSLEVRHSNAGSNN